jgi:hypothetical protein
MLGFLDDGDGGTELGSPSRRGHSREPAADDKEVGAQATSAGS